MGEVRVYECQKGDVIAVSSSAIDMGTLKLISNGYLKPIKIEKRRVKKFLFFTKKVKYIVFEVMGGL